MAQFITTQEIVGSIYSVRDQSVIMDSDLARFYGTSTKKLNQQVARNQNRFPKNFYFRLTTYEFECLKAQIPKISQKTWGGRRYPPVMYKEHGAVLAASVLTTERAREVSVSIVEAFFHSRVEMRSHQPIGTEVISSIGNQISAQIFSQLDQRFAEFEVRLMQGEVNSRHLPNEGGSSYRTSKDGLFEQLNRILQSVSKYFCIQESSLRGHSRKKDIVVGRQVAIYLIKKLLGLTYQEIAEFFELKDHTTPIHACTKIAMLVGSSAQFKNDLDFLESELRNLGNQKIRD